MYTDGLWFCWVFRGRIEHSGQVVFCTSWMHGGGIQQCISPDMHLPRWHNILPPGCCHWLLLLESLSYITATRRFLGEIVHGFNMIYSDTKLTTSNINPTEQLYWLNNLSGPFRTTASCKIQMLNIQSVYLYYDMNPEIGDMHMNCFVINITEIHSGDE